MNNIWKLTTFKVDSYWKLIFYEHWMDINWYILGWWSNILLTKLEYDKPFIKVLNSDIKKIDDNVFEVWWWTLLNDFIIYLNKIWIKTLNPLYWIYWTIWWAVYWNAWSFWEEIWKYVIKVVTNKGDFNYEYWYRYSNLKWQNLLIYKVFFRIPFIEYKDIWYYMNLRRQKQPRWNTCWSFFKNVPIEKVWIDFLKKYKLSFKDYIPAWWLIEQVWLKWYRYRDVKVSELHANFIINYWTSWKDIYDLSIIIKEKVYEKFKIILEEEVVIL